ncbi:metallophosphoesterase, partial [Thermodesulfobacteriota bacterium]
RCSNEDQEAPTFGRGGSLAGLLLVFGCAPKLFEVNIDKSTIDQEMKMVTDSKYFGLIEVLKKRPNFELIEAKEKTGIKRFVRRDLQDFIDDEWIEGVKYINAYPLEIYASGVNSGDGLLVKRENLPVFEFEDHASPKLDSELLVKLSFVHLSDVQLRDERVYMFGEKLTQFGDYLADGFQHEPDMVAYDYAYYLTQIGIINRLKNLLEEDESPMFMIHTGDALHMGVVSELYEFIYMTNKLNIPWFNALGNHDYQVFGNLNAKDVGVIRPNMGFQTVNSRYNFINMHGRGFNVDRQVYLSPDNAPDNNTRLLRSIYNGFDMSSNGTSIRN